MTRVWLTTNGEHQEIRRGRKHSYSEQAAQFVFEPVAFFSDDMASLSDKGLRDVQTRERYMLGYCIHRPWFNDVTQLANEVGRPD
jgi:hypothetical protein